MARTKNVFSPRRPQSAPKPNSEKLDDRKGGNESIKGQAEKKERRIGRTAVNWTGNKPSVQNFREPEEERQKNSSLRAFDFRNNEADGSSKERRSRSVPYISMEDDDVFTNSSVEHEKLVRKVDVDLSILQTVANVNDQDTVSNRSGSDMGSLDKKQTGGLLHPGMERNGYNSSLNSR